MGRLRAALVDVGGTLLPDNVGPGPEQIAAQQERLASALPCLEPRRVARLLLDLLVDAGRFRDELDQPTDELIAARLRAIDPALAIRTPAVRSALGGRWTPYARPFPGYRDLLLAARDLGLRRVLVSNTGFTNAQDWHEVIAPALGLDGLLDGVVTSYDVRFRKPHPAMFERALEIAGHAAPECVMIGNDERKDVEPAKELGMFVIRVAIQDPPTPTRADRLVTSLEEAREALTNA